MGPVGINNAFAPIKKNQNRCNLPLVSHVLKIHMLSRRFALDHAGEAYSAPPDLLGLLAEFAGSHDRESRVETRHTHITAAKDSLPTGQPVAGFAIGD